MTVKELLIEIRSSLKDIPELNKFTSGDFAFSDEDIIKASHSAIRKINRHGGMMINTYELDNVPEHLLVPATEYYLMRSDVFLKARNKHIYRDNEIVVDRESNLELVANLTSVMKAELDLLLDDHKDRLNLQGW